MTTPVYQPKRAPRSDCQCLLCVPHEPAPAVQSVRVESWKSTGISVAICIAVPCLIGIAAMVWA